MSEEKDAIALVEQLTRKVIAGEIKPSHYSKVLCSLPNHLRHSVEVALAAVRCFLPALFYFPPDIRNNTEVIAAALSTDPDRVKEQFALYHLYLDSPGHFYHEFPVAQYIFIPMILLDDSIRNDIFCSNMACDFLLAYLSHALEVGEFETQMNDLSEIDAPVLKYITRIPISMTTLAVNV